VENSRRGEEERRRRRTTRKPEFESGSAVPLLFSSVPLLLFWNGGYFAE
jgi:hypothetical protein